MKKLMIAMTAAMVAVTTFSKTLEEVRSEYTDGTFVYTFQYKGNGAERFRFDTVKLSDGTITVKKVYDPETATEKAVNKTTVVNKTEEENVVFAVTNKHNQIRKVIKNKDGKFVIKLDTVKAEKETKTLLKSSKKLLKASDSNKKELWQYKTEDIEKYVEKDPSNTNQLVSVKKSAKLLGATTTVAERKALIAQNKLERDGGYYIMTDGTVVSYRDALNHGFATSPTNDLQQAVFDDVINDPDSMYSKRLIFRNQPTLNSKTQTVDENKFIRRRR